MARVPGCEAVYDVANQWRERCLESDRSLLWPDLEEPTWTVENIESLLDAFIGNPDQGKESFTAKWKRQLEDQSMAVHRVATDVMAVYQLFPSNVTAGKKESAVLEVSSWKTGPPQAGEITTRAFQKGIGNPGIFYQTGRPWQVAYLLRFAFALKQSQTAFADRWAVQELADSLPDAKSSGKAARHILLHLLFPDYYEAIASQDHKARIVQILGNETEQSSDIDDALLMIRDRLERTLNKEHFGFYDGDIYHLWNSGSPETTTLPPDPPDPSDPHELDHPRIWIDKSSTWASLTDPTVHSENSLVFPVQNASGHGIWDSMLKLQEGDIVLRLRDTEAFCQRAVVEKQAETVSGEVLGDPNPRYLVKLSHVEQVRPELRWSEVKQLIGPRLLDIATESGEALFYLAQEDLRLRSFEGVTVAPPQLIDALNDAAMQLIGRELLPSGWPVEPWIDDLASMVHMPSAELTVMLSLLESKRQLIFEGPPGTGKTYTAKLFARYLAGLPLVGPPDPQVEIVQFHQSYGYEDFVAGIRPSTTTEGTIRYDVQPGIFIEMCKRAEANPDRNFVLIIDEINRGNVSRIFGELLYALEYRDEPVRLQYPDLLGDVDADHLTIPKNLFLIGTMNSTDRSLAMIDYALRRRFFFWKLKPIVDGQAPVLEEWMRANGFSDPAIDDISARFVAINQQVSALLNPDYAIGQSYFMDRSIGDHATRERIWTYALQPLLEEYFHSRHDRDEDISTLRHLMLDD